MEITRQGWKDFIYKEIIILLLAIVLVFGVWGMVADSNGKEYKRIENLEKRINGQRAVEQDLRN